ncbi:hypothetical protein A6A04_07425 [Paramagnetospirillum marisnigri]|uniref:Phosphonate ABC transporter substrate-binding protein n=1 Tax=Paramagnetospirillum marisnigri TaxID=1285242 RepID=A0A178MAZ6_9PROT|nr:phosphate/phosphite/phosphonate ABC transporter substrate-binding protein [Paramagnetospirillum marisnigri]OAN45684.1 hypothetical protein A6A04_07295 [Paramagnetospirillum marisnigri]OAN45706.1 hypothetical protein A6A04_07425 [Paramagnetospirillum marisnigri]
MLIRGIFALAAGALALAGLKTGALAADAPAPPLRFALIATEASSEVQAKWTPVLDALACHLGRSVVAEVSADYAGAIWALRNGRAQLAWLGNKAALEAVDHAGAEVFAQHVYPSGLGGYYSTLIVRTSSSLASADDLIAQATGLTLAMGDPNSTSGTLVPGHYLFASRSIEPRRVFKRVIQGSHEDNVHSLLEGRADAATVASVHLDGLLRRRPELANAFRVIWRSPLIPADPLLWGSSLPAEAKAQVKAFFLDYGRPAVHKSVDVMAAEQAALKRLDLSGFIASDNGQLAMVKDLEQARRRMAEVKHSSTTGKEGAP